ncbi:hypothetical protein P691DRAFT_369512 [Macrolepiota fuliginosa MF-IS2]|uniref:Uncharacterized protein n=1 Tax=Macrolepiota fuliginosa MF-IS2 TaxID=1400762 RepID=A0A9P5X431_9AGAR|nr:hypothetical protein P691DRAFT_369512 [Macrolepiota fuliginosa MF-IS2]
MSSSLHLTFSTWPGIVLRKLMRYTYLTRKYGHSAVSWRGRGSRHVFATCQRFSRSCLGISGAYVYLASRITCLPDDFSGLCDKRLLLKLHSLQEYHHVPMTPPNTTVHHHLSHGVYTRRDPASVTRFILDPP